MTMGGFKGLCGSKGALYPAIDNISFMHGFCGLGCYKKSTTTKET